MERGNKRQNGSEKEKEEEDDDEVETIPLKNENNSTGASDSFVGRRESTGSKQALNQMYLSTKWRESSLKYFIESSSNINLRRSSELHILLPESAKDRRYTEFKDQLQKIFKKDITYTELLLFLKRNDSVQPLPLMDEIFSFVLVSWMNISVNEKSPISRLLPVNIGSILNLDPNETQESNSRRTVKFDDNPPANAFDVFEFIFSNWIVKNPGGLTISNVISAFRTSVLGLMYLGPRSDCLETYKKLLESSKVLQKKLTSERNLMIEEKRLVIEGFVFTCINLILKFSKEPQNSSQLEEIEKILKEIEVSSPELNLDIIILKCFTVNDVEVKNWVLDRIFQKKSHFSSLPHSFFLIRILCEGCSFKSSPSEILAKCYQLIKDIDPRDSNSVPYVLKIALLGLSDSDTISSHMLSKSTGLIDSCILHNKEKSREFFKHFIEIEGFDFIQEVFINVMKTSNSEIKNFLLESGYSSFCQRVTVEINALDIYKQPITDIFKLVRQFDRKTFYQPLLSLPKRSSKSTEVSADLMILDLYLHFFRLDELFWPERLKSLDLKQEIDKPDLFLKLLSMDKHKTNLLVLLEFLLSLKKARRQAAKNPNYDTKMLKKNLLDLEFWIGAFLRNKQEISMTQRLLICHILIEMRKLQPDATEKCRVWLSVVVGWLEQADKKNQAEIDENLKWAAERYKTIGTMTMTPFLSKFNTKSKAISKITPNFMATILTLLASVQTFLEGSFEKIFPKLWSCLGKNKNNWEIEAAFLSLVSFEEATEFVQSFISEKIYSSDVKERISTIEKLASLFEHRKTLVVQERSSKYSGSSLIFNPTAFGSEEPSTILPNWVKRFHILPRPEVKNSEELQSESVDQEKKERDKTERSAHPLTMIDMINFFAEVDVEHPRNLFPLFVTVSSLLIVDLLSKDKHVEVVSRCRNYLWNLSIYEPFLFIKQLLIDLSQTDLPKVTLALTRLRRIVTLQRYHPSRFTYVLFNHLLGLLKWYQEGKRYGLYIQSAIIPILSDLVYSINGLRYSELKKEKFDLFLINNSQLYFPEKKIRSTEKNFDEQKELFEAMFPTKLNENINPALISSSFEGMEPVISQVFCLYMLRIQQTIFMSKFIQRFPYELSTLNQLILESPFADNLRESPIVEEKVLQVSSFVRSNPFMDTWRLKTWLQLLDNVFRNFSQTFYFTEKELEPLIRSIIEILHLKSNEFEILRQSLSLFITISTRFKAYFRIKGYELFVKFLFKTYCKHYEIYHIRSGLEYTFERFYNLHGESFTLQLLRDVSTFIASKEHARMLFSIFSAMNKNKSKDLLGVSGLAILPPELPDNLKVMPFEMENLLKTFLTVIGYEPLSKFSVRLIKILTLLMDDLMTLKNWSPSIQILIKKVFSKILIESRSAQVARKLERALRRIHDSSTIQKFQDEFLIFMTCFFRSGSEVDDEVMNLIAKIVKWIIKIRLDDLQDESKIENLGFLEKFLNNGILEIKEEKCKKACLIVTNKIYKILHLNQKRFENIGAIFECLTKMTRKFPESNIQPDLSRWVDTGIDILLDQDSFDVEHYQRNHPQIIDFIISELETSVDHSILGHILQRQINSRYIDLVIIPICLSFGLINSNSGNESEYWINLVDALIQAYPKVLKEGENGISLLLLAIKIILLRGTFETETSTWMRVANFMRFVLDLENVTTYKLNLLTFISVFRTPLFIFMKTNIFNLVSSLKKNKDQEYQDVIQLIENSIKPGKKGWSIQKMLSTLLSELKDIRKMDSFSILSLDTTNYLKEIEHKPLT